MFKRQYRIVTDAYAGFEVQKRIWYFPFWYGLNGLNTNLSVRLAEKLIEIDKIKTRPLKSKVVKIYPCD
jgi:hypothetical protein